MPDTSRIDIRWTISNLLSLLRLLMAAPVIWAVATGQTYLALALCILGVLTDLGDGYLARKMNQITEFGKVIDPLADKVFLGGVAVALTVKGMLPLWLTAVILGRDVLILVGGLYIKRRTGVVLPSNYPGKVAALTLAFTIFFVIAAISETLVTVLTAVSLTLLAISLAMYVVRAAKAIRG